MTRTQKDILHGNFPNEDKNIKEYRCMSCGYTGHSKKRCGYCAHEDVREVR